ncbi:hypothetical protein ACOME3_001142 [Neoechinorhynchus agilis]
MPAGRVCCQGCKTMMDETDDVMIALDYYYHLNCAKCSYCNVALIEPNKCYTTRKGARLFCEYHYFQSHSPHCTLCGKRIKSDESIRSDVNELLYFHTECLYCALCECPIPPNGPLNLTRVHESHSQEGRFLLCDQHHKSWLDPKNIEAVKKNADRSKSNQETIEPGTGETKCELTDSQGCQPNGNLSSDNGITIGPLMSRQQRTLLTREQYQVSIEGNQSKIEF